MRLSLLLLCVVAATLDAQALPRGIDRSVDRFTGDITDRSTLELLDRTPGSEGSIFFALTRVQMPKDTTAGLAIVTMYSGKDWLWVRTGESLLIKADDSVFAVSRAGQPRTDIMGSGTAQEITAFPITKDELALISRARSVSFRFRGQNRTEDRDLSKAARGAVDIFSRWIAGDSVFRYLRR